MAGLPSRAGERCAVEQRHRTMTTCHQGRARNASALRPPQAAQPDGRAGCVAAKPPFSTANGGGSVHEPAGPAVCSLPTWRQSAGLCAARRRVAVCMDWLPAARAYTPPPSCPGQGGGKGVFDARARHHAGAAGRTRVYPLVKAGNDWYRATLCQVAWWKGGCPRARIDVAIKHHAGERVKPVIASYLPVRGR